MAIWHHLWAKVFKSETTTFLYFSPIDSETLKVLDIGLWEVGAQRRFNRVNKWRRKIRIKKNFFVATILDPLWAKIVKSETTPFHYFSPKDCKNWKSWDIGLWEVGAQRQLNRVSNSLAMKGQKTRGEKFKMKFFLLKNGKKISGGLLILTRSLQSPGSKAYKRGQTDLDAGSFLALWRYLHE